MSARVSFSTLNPLWANVDNCVRRDAIFRDLIVKICTWSRRLFILGAGLIDAFVSAFNQHHSVSVTTSASGSSCMKRIANVTTVCPAWAQTYQSLCLGSRPGLLRPSRFGLLKPRAKIHQLPSIRTTTRIVWRDCDGWCVFY